MSYPVTTPLTLSAIAILATFNPLKAHADIVFQDNFTDNDRTINPSWYANTGTPTITQSGGVLSLSGLNGSNTFYSATWSGSTFANVGDKLTLSATFRYTDSGQSNAGVDQEFFFAVGNGNNTNMTADSTPGNADEDDFGYAMALGGSSSGTNGTAIKEDSGGDRWLGQQSDTVNLLTSNSGPTASTTFKTFVLTITLNNLNGYDLVLTDGTTPINITDATPATLTFDTVTFGQYLRNPANTFDLDAISVDFTAIPEPASLALMGLGGLLMLGRGRRGVS